MGPPPLLSREDADYYHQAGPVPLPDDVPVDFLVGKMNLRVILPKGQCVRMSVERRYFIKPYNNRIILFYNIERDRNIFYFAIFCISELQ